MREISLADYAMGRDAQFLNEWELARENAAFLLKKVNALLKDLHLLWPDWNFEAEVSSGFRPSSLNEKIPNAAKKSLHMTGRAIDLKDIDGSFKLAFQPLIDPDHAALLRKYGLFMEHPNWTKTWVHFDIGPRADRPSRVFIPK